MDKASQHKHDLLIEAAKELEGEAIFLREAARHLKAAGDQPSASWVRSRTRALYDQVGRLEGLLPTLMVAPPSTIVTFHEGCTCPPENRPIGPIFPCTSPQCRYLLRPRLPEPLSQTGLPGSSVPPAGPPCSCGHTPNEHFLRGMAPGACQWSGCPCTSYDSGICHCLHDHKPYLPCPHPGCGCRQHSALRVSERLIVGICHTCNHLERAHSNFTGHCKGQSCKCERYQNRTVVMVKKEIQRRKEALACLCGHRSKAHQNGAPCTAKLCGCQTYDDEKK